MDELLIDEGDQCAEYDQDVGHVSGAFLRLAYSSNSGISPPLLSQGGGT